MNYKYLIVFIFSTCLYSCGQSSEPNKEISKPVVSSTIDIPIRIESDNKPNELIKVLIVDGINNHNWQETTARIKAILEPSGLFDITVSTTPSREATDKEWSRWRPEFSAYDVILNNFNGGHNSNGKRWPDAVEKAFESYVKNGGGVVNFHAANNAFLNWQAYNEMIGLGWRNPSFGRGVIVDATDKLVYIPKGEGLGAGHKENHDFVMTVFERDHPITVGFPQKWMHAMEQLSHGQRGPAKNMTVLHYAWSKDSKRNEPIDWIVNYGDGRVYTTMLGHLMQEEGLNFRSVGFRVLLIRALQWTATQQVTYPVPSNFPSSDAIILVD
ncbi:ThuA domain-containing protein [Thalassotalea nanhaiensis]|uniref:ThuA domain-containing protein n=1 Tax=Thalassotalea nanhaiensis TaxID=3065648 RepID=A0ABY9TK72_9GAMM|nr:ThuA domain-containing protein [Colwelliaceae bacterium SQ345]